MLYETRPTLWSFVAAKGRVVFSKLLSKLSLPKQLSVMCKMPKMTPFVTSWVNFCQKSRFFKPILCTLQTLNHVHPNLDIGARGLGEPADGLKWTVQWVFLELQPGNEDHPKIPIFWDPNPRMSSTIIHSEILMPRFRIWHQTSLQLLRYV